MHKWAKEILECVKAKVEAIGIDNFEGQNLDDLKDWTEIAKNIACFDKDYRIVEAMDKAEDEDEIMEMIERYEDYPERRYYDNYRYKTSGRFAPRGKGSYMPRRGYEEPPYYHMMPYEMSVGDYKEHSPEYWRDFDRKSGRLYYTETGDINGKNTNMPNSDIQNAESRYDKAKRMYTETKDMHKAGTAEDKAITLKEGEKMLNVIFDELEEIMQDASPEMRSMVKTKGLARMQKIQ